MSYNKVLNILIDVYTYSSVKLDYPNNQTITVWLKDANEPYLQVRHLVLTVYISLSSSSWTQTSLFFTKEASALVRLNPLLDSYQAPYKIGTRYWTRFFLLVHCALYIVFSLGSSTHITLLVIIMTFRIHCRIFYSWYDLQEICSQHTGSFCSFQSHHPFFCYLKSNCSYRVNRIFSHRNYFCDYYGCSRVSFPWMLHIAIAKYEIFTKIRST